MPADLKPIKATYVLGDDATCAESIELTLTLDSDGHPTIAEWFDAADTRHAVSVETLQRILEVAADVADRWPRHCCPHHGFYDEYHCPYCLQICHRDGHESYRGQHCPACKAERERERDQDAA
jgi:hypothetical protein